MRSLRSELRTLRWWLVLASAALMVVAPRPVLAAGEAPAGSDPLRDLLDPVVGAFCGLLKLPVLCPEEPPQPPPEPTTTVTSEPATTSVGGTVSITRAPGTAVPGLSDDALPNALAPTVSEQIPVLAGTEPPSTTAPPPLDGSGEGSRRGGRPAANAGPLALALPADVDFSPPTIALALAASVVGLILIGFPAELFNQSLRENYETLQRLFPWIGRIKSPANLPWQVGALVVSSAIAGFVGAFQNLGDWSASEGVLVAVSLGIGFLVTTAVYEGVSAAAAVALHMPQRTFRAYPGALPFVGLFVAISAAGGLQPAYVYGHIAGSRMEADASMEVRKSALQTAAGSAALMLLALLCWGLRPLLPQVAADFLAGITIVALNWLVFSLIPVTFLEGETPFRHSKPLWVALYVPSLVLFLLLVIVPATQRSGGGPIGVSLVLFLLFAAVSLAVWGYFRIRSQSRGRS